MVCSSMPRERRNITVSVIILGGALATVFLAYFVFGDTNDEQGLRTLRMISIICRHGDRAPTELYPNDPHIHYEWSGGFGSLSELGALQMYNLGKNLRTRYYRLLPANGLYSKDAMYIISSAAERCIMSAQSLLAGFIPPLENHNILPIGWQPVAVNTIPRIQDHLIAQKRPCLKYDNLLREMYTNPPLNLAKLNRKSASLYKFLEENTGKNISNVGHVESLYNTLEIEKMAGLTLPHWTEDVFPDQMLPLAERNLALLTETNFMKKIKGGALLTEIHENMVRKHEGRLTPDRKIFIYSGHDVTLINVMNALNVLNQTSPKPDYGATLVFELHDNSHFPDDFEIKLVYYFGSEDKFPQEIDIPNCNNPCSFLEFSKLIDHLLVKNYEEACEIN